MSERERDGTAKIAIKLVPALAPQNGVKNVFRKKPRKLKTKAQKRGRSSRRKGHQFEREIAILLREIWPGAKRQLEYQESSCLGVDIAETGEFKFQCKKLKKYASISAIREIQCDELLGDVPILVTAGDNLEAMAILPFRDLLRLLKSFTA